MSAANLLTEPDAITVEQFLDMHLPDSCEWLLVHGTVVSVTHARYPHSRVQSNVHALLLDAVQGTQALVFSELPYQLDRTNGHRADVAVLLSPERGEQAAQADSILKGAPELVVEVMSRSNLPYDVDELERECLASGCLVFWKVVIQHRQRLERGVPDYSVRVGTVVDGRFKHTLYQRNDVLRLELPGIRREIAVHDIFEGVRISERPLD